MDSSYLRQNESSRERDHYGHDRYQYKEHYSHSIEERRNMTENHLEDNRQRVSRDYRRNENDILRRPSDGYFDQRTPTTPRQSYGMGSNQGRSEYLNPYDNDINYYYETSPGRDMYPVDSPPTTPPQPERNEMERRTISSHTWERDDSYQVSHRPSAYQDRYNEDKSWQNDAAYPTRNDCRIDVHPGAQRVQFVSRSDSGSYNEKKISDYENKTESYGRFGSFSSHDNKYETKFESKFENRPSRGVHDNKISKVNDPKTIDPRSMIEVAPGEFLRLRGADETWKAVHNDFYMPCQCFCCDLMLFCIQDAVSVLCPTCYVVSPLEGGVLHDEHDGGVGLGFTIESLAKWQDDIRKKAQQRE